MKKLPMSVIASLGLAGCTGIVGPCLSPQPCLDIEITDDTDETDATDDTDSADASDVIDRVLDRDVLPADIAERMRKRRA